jgi:hypothetical protein
MPQTVERRKQYYLENKEKMKEYARKYNEAHHEGYLDYHKRYNQVPEVRKKLLAYLKEKVECKCGHAVCRVNVKKHLATKLHQKRMVAEKL